jgi:hypothetical protein
VRAGEPSGHWARNRLLAGTLILFAARLALSAIRTGPVLVADEIGYLTNARLLAGGHPGQLEMAPFYKGGYSLLLTPLVDLASSPTLAYHLILALNAVLAASVFPLLYLLLTRFLGISPRIAIWASLAGALYPALTTLSQVAMSENALYPLICAWLIALAGTLSARAPRTELLWAAGLGAVAAALWSVHNRMVVVLVLTLAVLIWQAARGRVRPANVGLACAVAAAGIVASHFLDSYLIDHNFGGRVENEAGERFDDLFAGHGLRTAAANLLGQAWYLVVATFGLAAVVLMDVVGRLRAGGAALYTTVASIPLALAALLLLVSAAAFPERTRPDMLIYGRYVEIVAPPLIALGLATLVRRGRTLALGRSLFWLALLTGAVVLIRATASETEAANRWNISALPFVTVQLGPAILLGASVIAVCGAYLLVRAAPRGPAALGTLAAALLVAVTLYGVWNPVRSSQRAVYPSGWASPQTPAEDNRIRRIGYDLDHYDTIGLYTTQWFLPHTSLVLFHGGRQPPPAPFVLSSASWRRDHPGARALWSNAGRDEVLWDVRRHPASRSG